MPEYEDGRELMSVEEYRKLVGLDGEQTIEGTIADSLRNAEASKFLDNLARMATQRLKSGEAPEKISPWLEQTIRESGYEIKSSTKYLSARIRYYMLRVEKPKSEKKDEVIVTLFAPPKQQTIRKTRSPIAQAFGFFLFLAIILVFYAIYLHLGGLP